MRLFLTLIIILGIIIAIYFSVMTAIAKVSFEIRFKGLDLTGINISNIISGSSTANVQIGAKVINRNNFSIKINDFHIWIYYQGTLICQSSDTKNNLSKVVIPANGTIDVTHEVTAYLNSTLIQVIRDLKDRKELRFDYTSDFKTGIDIPVLSLINFPYTYKDYFTYKI